MNGVVKRGEDLLIAGAAVVLLSPVLLVTALLVRLSSPGPIFFVQPRIGFNNELIKVLKFRTMYADQSDLKAEQTTTADDPRITPIGRTLRKFSLDELPQLFNVIRGDMSLVGPRPHATHMKVGDRYYQDAVRGYAGRHRVKPGISGLAQVKGVRGEIRTIERAKKRVELDTKYIENWSLWLDLGILALDVPRGDLGQGRLLSAGWPSGGGALLLLVADRARSCFRYSRARKLRTRSTGHKARRAPTRSLRGRNRARRKDRHRDHARGILLGGRR